MPFSRLFATATLAMALMAAPPGTERIPDSMQQALASISPNAFKGHISFLASDLLEGRNTPSRGLDIAAEYIAAQFRRAGLDPIPGTNSYFQTANWTYRQTPLEGVTLTIEHSGQSLVLDQTHLTINSLKEVKLDGARVFRVRLQDLEALRAMPEDKLQGMAVLLTMSRLSRRGNTDLSSALRRLKPALVLVVNGNSEQAVGSRGQLIDPANERRNGFTMPDTVHSRELAKLIEETPFGEMDARLSVSLPAATESAVALRNVIGVIPGSDPRLKDTYILITAHYDHIGVTTPENGDGIYNGANDDASGTASVIELAAMFSALKERPKRTLVFMTVFGEEKGLLGSAYYARNPVFPLSRTIADINLEHMGRTDSTDGPQVNKLSMTGYDFTDLSTLFADAGKLTGVEIVNHPTNSDAFFNRSDNAALAQHGVPAHTFCVAYEFPDYHGLGDHWEKIDYQNMTRVNRTVGAALWMLSEHAEPPRWNESNSKTTRYREAQKSEGNKTPQ